MVIVMVNGDGEIVVDDDDVVTGRGEGGTTYLHDLK